MKSRVTVHLIMFLIVAAGCAHNSPNATVATNVDAAPASAAVNTGPPALVVPEWFFDFGEVQEGGDYLHSFVIRNKGTGVLEIKKVQPG